MKRYTIKAKPTQQVVRFDSPDKISQEIEQMFIELRRAVESKTGDIELMNLADAYYARGSEIKFYIHRGERTGDINGSRQSKDAYHMIRTGELDDFLDACKVAAELGSRRLSAKQLEFNQNVRGMDSA